MNARFLPIALLLSACAPQNAVLVDGEYFAFISNTTSFSLQKGSIDPYDWGPDDAWTIDCRDFGGGAANRANRLSGISADCAPEDTGEKCVDRRLASICSDWVEVPQTEDPIEYRPEDETWLGQNAWWVLAESLDPWRGEAVITSEDDLQIGFHHRLPGGEDFRFVFAVDPDFAPQRCSLETGEPEPRDGDWIANWSNDLKKRVEGNEAFPHFQKYLADGTLFYLNADGFQFNPGETSDYWYLPEHWEAGAAGGKFADEAFFSRSPLWGYNEAYEFFETYDPYEGQAIPITKDDLFVCDLEEGEDPRDNNCWQGHEEELGEIVASITTDLSNAISPKGRDESTWGPLFHNNAWRPADGLNSGFDGWHELHYNMVVFDKSPDQIAKLEPGDSVKGAFTLVMDGADSNSRFLLRGEFDVPKIKKDRWVTNDIRAQKLEENGNSLCVLQ